PIPARLQDAREREKERGARPAVAGADERELAVELRVVLPGNDDAFLAGAGDRGDEIDHPDLVDRRLDVPDLLDGGQPPAAELILDVLPRQLDRRRARRTRADGDQLPEMFPRAPRIELRRRRHRLEREDGDGDGS